MIEITFPQMLIFITAAWIFVRLVCNVKSKTFSLKREMLLLLVYICIVVIARFVYFELNPVLGYPLPLRIVGPVKAPVKGNRLNQSKIHNSQSKVLRKMFPVSENLF